MANAITGIRIVFSLALIPCPTFSVCFYVLYTVCGVSDILDGIVARTFGKETKIGARLDTIADLVFFAVAVTKTVRVVAIPRWVLIWTACIAAIKIISLISGFALYRRFVSEHTVMNKVCGVLLFAVPLCAGLLPPKPLTVPVILTCATATFAAIQEGHYIRSGKEIG